MSTKLVDDVAKSVVKRGFRGCVLGQQGLFLDKQALQEAASGFNIDEYLAQDEALRNYIETYGPLKF